MIRKISVLGLALVCLLSSSEIFALSNAGMGMKEEGNVQVEGSKAQENLTASMEDGGPEGPLPGDENGVAESRICRRVRRCTPYGCYLRLVCWYTNYSEDEIPNEGTLLESFLTFGAERSDTPV